MVFIAIHIGFSCDIDCMCPYSCYSNYNNISNFDINVNFCNKCDTIEEAVLSPVDNIFQNKVNNLIVSTVFNIDQYNIISDFLNNENYYNFFLDCIILNYNNLSLEERLQFIELYKVLENLRNNNITFEDFVFQNTVLFEFFKDKLNEFFFDSKLRGDYLYKDFKTNLDSLHFHSNVIKEWEENNSYFRSSYYFMMHVFNNPQLNSYYNYYNTIAVQNNLITPQLLNIIEKSSLIKEIDSEKSMEKIAIRYRRVNKDNYDAIISHIVNFYNSCKLKFGDNLYKHIILNENYFFLNDLNETKNQKVFLDNFKDYIKENYTKRETRDLYELIKIIKKNREDFYLNENFLKKIDIWFDLNKIYINYIKKIKN